MPPNPSSKFPGLRGIAVTLGALLILAAGVGIWLSRSGDKKPPAETPSEELILTGISPLPDHRVNIVQPAVDKGVKYLKSIVPGLKGNRSGYHGLVGLTLLECGVSPEDPAILSLAEMIRTGAPVMNQNYDLAASLFFLNRWDESRPLDEKDRSMARSFALRIIAGQLANGIWAYAGEVLTPEKEKALLESLEKGNYKPTLMAVGHESMSNTQFAMLAIWGARKHGIKVGPPLLALAAYLHEHQFEDGRWIYPGHSLAATSTCAGLIGLAIEKAFLVDKEFADQVKKSDVTKKRASVNKAFDFVSKTIGRKKGDPGGGTVLNPPHYGGAFFDADAIGDLYFLWTLERVGVIYSKDEISGKNWYDWGYPIVLAAQKPNGSWDERRTGDAGFGPEIDTCFALLFLRRANIAQDLTQMLLRSERK